MSLQSRMTAVKNTSDINARVNSLVVVECRKECVFTALQADTDNEPNQLHLCDNSLQATRALRITTKTVLAIDIDYAGNWGVDLIAKADTFDTVSATLAVSDTVSKQQLIALLSAGVNGIILRRDLKRHLPRAINKVALGRPVFSEEILVAVVSEFRKLHRKKQPSRVLTFREGEILNSIARGCSYKAVARDLGISHHTVPSHIKNIYRKLDVNSASEAVYEGLRLGVVDLVY